MSRQLECLLAIDELIRQGHRPTAVSLGEQLEVSDRTIRSDLAFLRDRYHAPLEYNPKRGYHYTDPHWRLPSVSLSQGELFALTLGARLLAAYAGSAYETQLQSAITQLAQRLPEQTHVDLQQLATERVLFRTGAELDLDPQIWHTLEQGCQQRRRVWMRYGTPGKPVSERELDPYVTGWCHLRQEPRWFRVDRIQAIRLLDQRFEVDPSFDREAHLESAFQHEVGGIPQGVAIWFDPATAPYIRERRWHSTQEIEEHRDGSLTLRLVVRGLNEMKRWVLFYGGGARVLEPPELVDLIKGELQQMQLRYQESPSDGPYYKRSSMDTVYTPRFWAKTGQGQLGADGQPLYHPVICHLADTAAVAQEIVRSYLSSAAIAVLEKGLGVSGAVLRFHGREP